MAFRDLIPFRRNEPTSLESADPFESFHREIDRLFEDFWGGGPLTSRFGDRWPRMAAVQMPRIDVSESDGAYEVSAELPGLEEKDIHVGLADGVLTIEGEKRQEEEKKDKSLYYTERSFGSFRRTLQVPADVNEEAIKANFKNGVLCLTLPKTKEAVQKARKIEIQKS